VPESLRDYASQNAREKPVLVPDQFRDNRHQLIQRPIIDDRIDHLTHVVQHTPSRTLTLITTHAPTPVVSDRPGV
jgi:hypothetical protein